MRFFLGPQTIVKKAAKGSAGQHYDNIFSSCLKIDVFFIGKQSLNCLNLIQYQARQATFIPFTCNSGDYAANKMDLLRQSDFTLQRQSYRMLSLHNRYNQLFLIDYSHSTFPSLDCCRISHPMQLKTTKTSQLNNNQHKKSLKTHQKQKKSNPSGTSVAQLSATLPRNLNRKAANACLSDSNHTLHPLRINRVRSQEIHANLPTNTTLVHQSKQNICSPLVSQANTHFFPHLVFTYSEPRQQIFQQTNTELAYVKEIQNIEQTTCLQFLSQESVSHYFGKAVKITCPPVIKKQGSQEQLKVQRQGQQWSDESLSSETQVHFQQIEEEESLSDSYSAHLKNKVTVAHNHSPTFEQFRKTHSIRSNLSDSSSHFSGHSIVLEKQHNFLTPHKHRYFHNDA